MHVEDHPMEYLHFEGVIPEGEYGGGDVIVWDTGTWEPAKGEDPAKQLANGELHADVHGEKLRGRLVLVRRDDKDGGGDGDKEQWLLLHKKDEWAEPGWDPEAHPRSVLTGRTNDEVKQDPDRMWRSGAPADEAEVSLLPEPAPDEAIQALEDLGSDGVWDVFGRELKVTNLDKVLFPGVGDEPPVTKRELLAYVARIAPLSLPYLEGRAVNLHRYPDGADTRGFWHKEVPDHAPEWLPRWDNPEADPGETQTSSSTSRPRCSGPPTSARWSGTRGPRVRRRCTSRRTCWSTSTRGRGRRGRSCWSWPGCTAPHWTTWG
jgi:bifunctional non-homologous end joining protein LigD